MSSIPSFPLFVNLQAISPGELKRFMSRPNLSSDNSIGNIFAWYGQGRVKISRVGRYYLIRSGVKNGFLIVGNTANSRSLYIALRRIFAYYPEAKIYNLCLTNAQLKSLTRDGKFTCAPDRGAFDYIYSTRELAELKGKDFAKKRLKINLFLRSYGDQYDVKIYDGLPEKSDSINNLIDTWAGYDRTTARLSVSEREKERLRRFIEHDSLKKVCEFQTLELYIRDRLVGFMIFERVSPLIVDAYFTKTNLNISGVSDFIMHIAAKKLYDAGVAYLNNEEDLGFKGLRESKLSFRPAILLPKYTVRFSGVSTEGKVETPKSLRAMHLQNAINIV